MRYFDGFVLSIPKKKLAAYKRLARLASKVWIECGALEYVESAGEDLAAPCGVPFPELARTRRGETVVFAWISYRSRAHRDRVNARVMKDPRMLATMSKGPMPFDMARMSYGGFKGLVEASAKRAKR